jgi:sugar-specific transcriptional regulator TrmB
MDAEKLQKLGLASNEAKVYIALASLGGVPVVKITEEAGIHPQLVYGSLESLLHKGLVQESFRDHKKFYQILDPHKLITEEEHKLELARAVARDISSLSKKAMSAQKVSIFQGDKAIVMGRKFIIDSVDDGGNYYVLNANIGEFGKAMGGEFERQERELAKRKIRQIFIGYENQKEQLLEFQKRYFKKVAREFYFLSEQSTTPMSIDFSEKRVVILVFGIEPLAIGISDVTLASGYKKIFETLKSTAKKYE